MFQIRFHGRGGQGVVTAAELCAAAAFDGGHETLAFPSFGSERTGAPVTAFCRVDDRPILTREPVVRPDLVVVQDATLLHHVAVFSGLADGGTVVINTGRPLGDLGLDELAGTHRVECVPATELARRHTGRPVPNACLLGALAAVADVVAMPALEQAIGERFPGAVAAGNIAACRAAYELVRREAVLGA